MALNRVLASLLNTEPKAESVLMLLVYVALTGFFGALLAHNHLSMVLLPTPLDIYEGLMPLITGLIASGENPYTYQYQPVYDDFYPPLYNIVVAPLTYIFENDYQLHRWVNAVFIFAACGLCLREVQETAGNEKHRSSYAHGFTAAVLLYAALIYYSTPIASTNALGVLLMMLTAIIPWRRKFDTPSLCIALLLGVLAFFAKQYYACATAFVAAYVFMFVSKQRAVVFAAAYACVLVLVVYVVHKTSPYFLDNTLWAVIYASSPIRSADVLIGQLLEFVRLYAGVIVLVALSMMIAWLAGGTRVTSNSKPLAANATYSANGWINIRPLSAPLFKVAANYYWFNFFAASAVIVVALGWHPANYMSYLFQLMSPFFLIAAFSTINRADLKVFLVIPLLAYSLFHTWDILWKDFDVDHAEWQRAEQIIQQNDNILASQILLLPLMKHGKQIHQAGHTFYFKPAQNKPDMFRHDNPAYRVGAVWANYMAGLYRQVERKEFDVVLLHTWDIAGVFLDPPAHVEGVTGPEYFRRFYKRSGVVRLSLTKRPGGGEKAIQIWTPK